MIYQAGWKRVDGEEIKPYLFSSWSLAKAFMLQELRWSNSDEFKTSLLDALNNLLDFGDAPWSFTADGTTYFINEYTQGEN